MLHGASSHPLPLSLFIESLSHATLSAEGRCLRVALRHAFLLPGRSLRSPHVTSTAYSCERGGRITQLQYFLQLSLRTSENPQNANFVEFYEREVRRIPIPRTRVNKGIRKGRGLTVPAQREPLPEINKLVSPFVFRRPA